MYLKKYKFGFSTICFLIFVLQELPYLPFFLFPPADNPLADNPPANLFLGILEGFGGVLTVALLILIVSKDKLESNFKDRYFIIAVCLLGLYYACWIAYFAGVTSNWLIVFGLSAPVPLYYFSVAMWRKNYFAAITAIVFFVGHTLSNGINYF
ncbi:MAG: hypothetical protein LBM93_00290 [Oscillospiraceae bacterium]|jgi:hypothetical protein|nr:hypothetical protein [Oscillospiraceae bacterium]